MLDIQETLFPWLLGILTAVLGFFVKWLTDYFWLKAPKLVVKASLNPTITRPPQNNYRTYHYELQIEIQNHSKNEAFGLEIIQLVMPTGLLAESSAISEKYEHVVSDTISARIEMKCYITLPITDADRTKDANQRMKDFGNKIKITFNYKNELGKKYNSIQNVEFQRKLSIVHSLQVKSFTPTSKQ